MTTPPADIAALEKLCDQYGQAARTYADAADRRKIESALRDRLQATVPAGSGNTWVADDDGITDADGYFSIRPNGDGWTVVSSRPSLHMEAVAVDEDEAVRAVAAMDAARGAFNAAMKRAMIAGRRR